MSTLIFNFISGDCDSPVTGTSSTAKKGGDPYRYYMCSDKQRKRKQSKCSSTRWPKEETEEAILHEIRKELTSPSLAEYLFGLYRERNKKQASQQETILQEIQSLTDRTNRLLDMVENGIGDMTAAAERIDQYTKRKKGLEYELTQTAEQVEYTAEHFRGYLNHIGKTLDARLDPYDAKKIIDTYVEKIILYPDNRVEVILKINLPPTPNGAKYGSSKGISYNVGAEGASLTYTHRFSLA